MLTEDVEVIKDSKEVDSNRKEAKDPSEDVEDSVEASEDEDHDQEATWQTNFTAIHAEKTDTWQDIATSNRQQHTISDTHKSQQKQRVHPHTHVEIYTHT